MVDPHLTTRAGSPYSDTLLSDLENRLLWARARISREFASLANDTLAVDEQRTWDQPGERAADEYAQSIHVHVLQNDADALWQIEEALERIQGRGERPYGRCEHCAEAPQHLCGSCPWIPDERLIALPWAAHCAQVQERLDQHTLVAAGGGAAAEAVPSRVRGTRVRALDRGLQQVNPWLVHVQRELGCDDREHAFGALRRTLHALRDRLPVAEAAQLAAQMPFVVRGIFYEGWRPHAKPHTDRSREDFLAAVARGLPALAHPAEDMARAVFAAIDALISPGEVGQVKHVLPRAVRELWPDRT